MLWGIGQHREKPRVSGGALRVRDGSLTGLQTREEEVLTVQLATKGKLNVRPLLKGKVVGTCRLGCQ